MFNIPDVKKLNNISVYTLRLIVSSTSACIENYSTKINLDFLIYKNALVDNLSLPLYPKSV
jgi:hypothetical protein